MVVEGVVVVVEEDVVVEAGADDEEVSDEDEEDDEVASVMLGTLAGVSGTGGPNRLPGRREVEAEEVEVGLEEEEDESGLISEVWFIPDDESADTSGITVDDFVELVSLDILGAVVD